MKRRFYGELCPFLCEEFYWLRGCVLQLLHHNRLLVTHLREWLTGGINYSEEVFPQEIVCRNTVDRIDHEQSEFFEVQI